MRTALGPLAQQGWRTYNDEDNNEDGEMEAEVVIRRMGTLDQRTARITTQLRKNTTVTCRLLQLPKVGHSHGVTTFYRASKPVTNFRCFDKTNAIFICPLHGV